MDLNVNVYTILSSGGSDLFALWNVKINITDINDNTPTFKQSVYMLSVPEMSPAYTTLWMSGAEDKDTGKQTFRIYVYPVLSQLVRLN